MRQVAEGRADETARVAPRPVTPFQLGDVLSLRKPHPCGGFEWEVVRLGADLGLRCQRCARRVLLPRATVERRLKAFVQRGSASPQTSRR